MVSPPATRSLLRPTTWDNRASSLRGAAAVDNRIIAEFLNYVRVEKRVSRNTAAAYALDLQRFCTWIDKRHTPPTEVTRIEPARVSRRPGTEQSLIHGPSRATFRRFAASSASSYWTTASPPTLR